MKKAARWLYPLVFLALCAAVIWFLQLFTASDQPITYLEWTSGVEIAEDGTETPYAIDTYTNTPAESGTFRFTTTLPAGLGEGYLLFETSGLELTLCLDGKTVYTSSAAALPEGTTGMSTAQLPLANAPAGVLTITCTILESENAFFPPLLRFIPDGSEQARQTAYANLYGIPAGIAAAAMLLVAGLFLLRAFYRKTEWSLLPLVAALGNLATYRLIQSCGYYFLPQEAVQFLSWRGFAWIAPLSLVAYLLLNRRREFWRLLGIAAAWSAGGLLLACLLSAARGGYLFSYVSSSVLSMFQTGLHDGLLYWFTLWLAVVCALISLYWFLRTLTRQQARMQALEIKNQMIRDSYHAIEQSMRDNAALRHEFRHQLTALDALYQQSKWNELGELLRTYKQQEAELAQMRFTENFTVNAILQDAASRAAQADTAFDAQVRLPKTLPVPENDLCALLMNMLDNALEACGQVEPPAQRFIRFKAEVKNGFFAVKCEDRYAGALRTDETGKLQTTKPDAAAHGFGLPQMTAIAEKYASLLDISQTEDHVFILQTALKLPKEPPAAP